MAPNTYQTFTEETPMDIYRSDFLRRGAMCSAMETRYLGDRRKTALFTVPWHKPQRAAKAAEGEPDPAADTSAEPTPPEG